MNESASISVPTKICFYKEQNLKISPNDSFFSLCGATFSVRYYFLWHEQHTSNYNQLEVNKRLKVQEWFRQAPLTAAPATATLCTWGS